MQNAEGNPGTYGTAGYGSPDGPVQGSPTGDYTPSSEDLVRQWHDLNGYYLEAKQAHENGEVGSTVPAGLQKQLMSVQEQIRKAQDVEGKLYTQADIGSVLSRFATICYGVIREAVGERQAAEIAEKIETKTEGINA